MVGRMRPVDIAMVAKWGVHISYVYIYICIFIYLIIYFFTYLFLSWEPVTLYDLLVSRGSTKTGDIQKGDSWSLAISHSYRTLPF